MRLDELDFNGAFFDRQLPSREWVRVVKWIPGYSIELHVSVPEDFHMGHPPIEVWTELDAISAQAVLYALCARRNWYQRLGAWLWRE